MDTEQIRNKFFQFFNSKGHLRVESSSLVPGNDPTLLFTNAGMVQFKDAFTGKAIPQNKRVITIQKCVRAGGKHNDLENVGFTARHHTFFEMMGNFSFGDYFKEEAIALAWEFFTEVLHLPKDKLYVSVHESDHEAAEIWHLKQGLSKDRIFYRGDKDNFWEMGELGPCGPSSEIFFDHGPEHSDPEADTSKCLLDDEMRYVEIWNLVFMQYEKYKENGAIKRRSLPTPSVDTGGGLERVAAAIQGVYNNFDTDLFANIIACVEEISNKKYNQHPQWMRVVADHARACTMLLSDGVIPANEGRGYVVRRIIRRAVRYLDLLGVKDPLFFKLVEPVIASLGSTYANVVENRAFIEKYLRLEEVSFRRTLSSGLKLLETLIEQTKSSGTDGIFGGELAFNLYDTHGFPLDLTEMIVREQGLRLDTDGFERSMAEQKERSKLAGDFSAKSDHAAEFYRVKEAHGDTEFLGYSTLRAEATLLSVVQADDSPLLVFDRTPFYAEGGGQLGDCGKIFLGEKIVGSIHSCKAPIEGIYAHYVKNAEDFDVGKKYQLVVDEKSRKATAANHTGTHLLQAALIQVLGSHVKQAGSSVGPKRLRFDFTNPEALTNQQLYQVESIINQQIRLAHVVGVETLSKDEAIEKGATALFGEKYGNTVRVVEIPGFSIELCGGTHVNNTKDIGYFKILSEKALASGIRRIEAVTGSAAFDIIESRLNIMEELELRLKAKGTDLLEKVGLLQDNLQSNQKVIKQLQDQLRILQAQKMFDDVSELKDGTKFKYFAADEGEDIRKLGELFLDKFAKGTVFLSSKGKDKSSVLLKTYKGNPNIQCSRLMQEGFAKFDGKGGGKPDLAQGSIASDCLDDFVKHVIAQIN